MTAIYAALAVCGAFPILKAWLANRETTLVHSLSWAAAAWIAWGVALIAGDSDGSARGGQVALRLFALFLTGAAGVAVFGARRPIAGAWNFVVLGLLCVLLLPLAESFFLGTPSLGPVRIFFIAATLAIGVLNYLPTTFAPAALILGAALAGECFHTFAPDLDVSSWVMPATRLCLLAMPWVAWAAWGWTRRTSGKSEAGLETCPTRGFDRLWLDFRDRFGVVWGQRTREQFNRAAAHAKWPAWLGWQGLVMGDGERATAEQSQEMIATLESMLRRFGPP